MTIPWKTIGLLAALEVASVILFRSCINPGPSLATIRAERDSALASSKRVLEADSLMRIELHRALDQLAARGTVVIHDVDHWRTVQPAPPRFLPGMSPHDSIVVLTASNDSLRQSNAKADTLLRTQGTLLADYGQRLRDAVARGDLVADTLATVRKSLADTKRLDCSFRYGEIAVGSVCFRPSGATILDGTGHVRVGIGYSLTRR